MTTTTTTHTPKNVFPEPTRYGEYNDQAVDGLLMSEKLNGVWARWDGEQLLTRNGNKIHAPHWFTKELPAACILEGELWLDYGRFQEVCGIVRSLSGNWNSVTFNLFNTISSGSYQDRMADVSQLNLPPHVRFIEQKTITSKAALHDYLDQIIKRGGEGIIIRSAFNQHKDGVARDILKLKPRTDAEAIVIDVVEGKGKMTGLFSALVVLFNNKTFKIGLYANQPKYSKANWLDKQVTFSFLELTTNGIPSQPAFIGIRDYE